SSATVIFRPGRTTSRSRPTTRSRFRARSRVRSASRSTERSRSAGPAESGCPGRLDLIGVRAVPDHHEYAVLIVARLSGEAGGKPGRPAERVIIARVDEEPAPGAIDETAADRAELVRVPLVDVRVTIGRPADVQRQLRRELSSHIDCN